MIRVFRETRKAVTCLGAMIAVLVTAGLLPDDWNQWVPIVLAVLGVIGTYYAPNEPPLAGDAAGGGGREPEHAA